jgi:hypothetical protein
MAQPTVLKSLGCTTVCFTYLDQGREMIIFESILTTFEATGSVAKLAQANIEPPWANLACQNRCKALY